VSSTEINEASRAQINLEAADWVTRLHDAEAHTKDHASFIVWVRRSKLHLAAFMAADDTFSRLEGIDLHRQWPLDSLRPQRPRWRAGFAVAAMVLIACVALYGLVRQDPHDIATRIGEQRVVKLSDGSVMMLNTQSRARIEYSAKERRVVLERGEALFTAARDTRRPFLVIANGTHIRALGTQFRVYQRASATTVTVIEGAVQVSTTPSSLGPTVPSQEISTSSARLSAGEQVDVDRGGHLLKHAAAPVSDVLAWRERQLVFRGTALAEIAAEFNRYNTAQIQIFDARAGRRKMSGTFDMDKPQALVAYLQKDETLRVDHDGDAWVVRRR
jgi:transmembrane sensor